MKTRRIFKEDVYMKEAVAAVTAVYSINGKTAVTLDQTIFFPEGGGQSCDLGQMFPLIGDSVSGDGFDVTDCYEYEDDIYHVLDCTEGALKEGDRVQLKLDWARRFDNMQRHCGEHILTGIIYREFGGINRGFHMGDEYMTIDISLEDEARVDKLDWEMMKQAELMTNEVIWQDLPMITRHFDTYEEAAKEPMRKKLAIEKDITLVGIGSTDYDWGCVACCGTHPSACGQVGMVKVFKIEPNKGMYRIYFEAGRRAFTRYQYEMDTLQALSLKLSAGTDDVLAKYDASIEKNKEKSTQLYQLKKEVIKREASSILAALNASQIGDMASNTVEASGGRRDPGRTADLNAAGTVAGARDGFYIGRYRILSLDDLMQLAREISPSLKKLAFLVHEPSTTVLLVSNSETGRDSKYDCGKLVKENAGIYNGKGGGNSTTARAIFSKAEYVDTFIDLIEKHLR